MSPTANPDPVDVLIVGTGGASGATVAKVLTEAGLRVVGLERGPWLKPEQFSGDEIKFINRDYLWPDPVLKPRTVRRDEQSASVVQQFSPLPQMVGGGTIHYSGWFPRATESDFKMRSLHGNIDGASLADWPFSYDDLEPYYTKIEWEFGVSGIAGANKYEARRSTGYPCPPAPLPRYGKVFYDTCAKLGYNAFPMPQAFVTKPYKGRTPLTSSGFVQQFGDPTSGKSTTQSAFTPDAIATGRYDLRPDCYVHELTLTKEGRVKGALYEDPDGHMVEQEAAAVIVCCGAVES